MAQLSIVVTSYNIEGYLPACLDSILAQTLQDLEIIVVDDGSTDSSPDIINKYAEADPRVVPVLLGVNSPGGVATAANAGLERATAPYVGFADGDDLYEPHMFEALLTSAQTHDSDLVMCNYREFTGDTTDQKLPADEHRWQELSQSSYQLNDTERQRFLKFIAVPWRKLYRRDLLERNNIRFPVGDYFFEDNPFHWFSLMSAESISVVPEVLCYHRVARAGQTMATADERLFRIFQHHETIYNYLKRIDRLDTFGVPLLTWAISQMEWISRRTEPALARKLYDELAVIFDHYSEAEIGHAIADGNKGAYASRLAFAVKGHKYPRFLESLKEVPKSRALPARLLNHLRYSGPKNTAKIAIRYVGKRLDARKLSLPKRGRSEQNKVSNEHLMLALASLENRLVRMEGQLRRTEAELQAERNRQA